MFIGKKDKYGIIYYSFKDVVKIHRLSIFFRYGFYVSLIIWMCGICFAMFSEVSEGIKVAVVVITLCIYIFFAIGKGVMEQKFEKRKSIM